MAMTTDIPSQIWTQLITQKPSEEFRKEFSSFLLSFESEAYNRALSDVLKNLERSPLSLAERIKSMYLSK